MSRKAEVDAKNRIKELEDQLVKAQQSNQLLKSKLQEKTKALTKSKSRYDVLVENATDFFYTIDIDGYLTLMSEKSVRSLGYKEEEVTGKHFLEFIPAEYREKTKATFDEIGKNLPENEYSEFPVQTKDKKVIWIGQVLNRVQNENGLYYYTAVARDITAKVKEENKLILTKKEIEQSELKYRSVLENMKFGIVEIDVHGLVTSVYNQFNKMLGYQKGELIGKNALDVYCDETSRKVIQHHINLRKRGISSVYEAKLIKKNGEELWSMIHGAPFYDSEGNIGGSLSIHLDITEQKKREKKLSNEKEKAEFAKHAKQQFLATMSHEIRTPLNAIIGMHYLLKETKMNKEQKEYLDILDNSTLILKNLVSDILDVSKIDAGKVEKHDSLFDIVVLSKEIRDTFLFNAQQKGIQLNLNVNAESSYIFTDRIWISKILMNLVSNAVKFTDKGQVNLNLHIEKVDAINTLVNVQVIDTGIGLNKIEKQRIFNEFIQANESIKNKYGGTGLGLSISTKLVKMLGGSIQVESDKGKGSVFYFNIVVPHKVEKQLRIKNENDSDKLDKEIRVLIAEDNVMNQKYITNVLDKWGVQYEIARNGKEALDLYNEEIDLILMDLSMPIMDGYETALKIRHEIGDTDTPIIALTASSFRSNKEQAIRSGMTDFLAKPYTPDELQSILEKYA